MFEYCYPRLDANVTKGMNHLLKSPFSIHPKTGRVSVPIDPEALSHFDPCQKGSVPSLNELCQQVEQLPKQNDEGNSKQKGSSLSLSLVGVEKSTKCLRRFRSNVFETFRRSVRSIRPTNPNE